MDVWGGESQSKVLFNVGCSNSQNAETIEGEVRIGAFHSH
jgi:hypothetical protein